MIYGPTTGEFIKQRNIYLNQTIIGELGIRALCVRGPDDRSHLGMGGSGWSGS
jgi:hypothetical protein